MDATRLPTIIGGSDLIDALCSQASQGDFIQVPDPPARDPVQAVNWGVTPTASTSRLAPARTTMKSSVFGG